MGRATHELVASAPQQVTEPQANNGNGLEQLLMQHQVDNTRIVYLYGEVSEQSIAQSIAQLLHLASQNHKPIYMIVSSYGGSVDEMFSLYDTMKFLPCPVHTVALGKVMSAGVLLLAAGVKGKRMVGRSTRLMMHPVSGASTGSIFDVINETKEHQRLQKLMVTSLASETTMSEEQIEKVMKSGSDYYMTSEQAIKFGIVDRVIGG